MKDISGGIMKINLIKYLKVYLLFVMTLLASYIFAQEPSAKTPSLLTCVQRANVYSEQNEKSKVLEVLGIDEPLFSEECLAEVKQWYLVKTESGIIGWIKSNDVTFYMF